MIHSLITIQNQPNLSQFQITANLRYYISTVIQNCHKDIIYPDVAEIVSTCHSYEELERELQYETSKICGFHKTTPGEELPSLARQVRNYLDKNFTQQITTKSFQDILVTMKNISPHFLNQNSGSLPANISVNCA